MKKKLLLAISWLTLTVCLSGCVPTGTSPTGPFFPAPSPAKKGPTGRYCLTKEELEALKSRPVTFYCNRTDIDGVTVIEENVPYVLAAEDVEVKRIFIHDQKQLILKENCGGIDYYTWKCHPPSWGSIYANTLWKLRDPDPSRKPLKNGDHFDVYLRQDVKDTEKFVCKNGGGVGMAAIFSQPPMAEILQDSPLEGKTIRIEDKSALWHMRSDAQKIDIETAPPRRKAGEITFDGVTYDVFVNLLKAFSPDEDKNFYLVETRILPEGNDNLPDLITYDVFAIVTEVKPKGLTLQLGTFDPRPPQNRWFDIYLPESKPVIYLYPEEPTELTVKVEPRDGYLTVSDPPYNPETGWQVMAYPDGTLISLNPLYPPYTTYPYLYYESEVRGYQIPEKGFVISKDNLEDFFHEVLPKLGLNQKETADFSEYWRSRFNSVEKPYVFITFLPQNQIDKVDPVTVSPLNTKYYFRACEPSSRAQAEGKSSSVYIPYTSIRVRAYFKPLEKPVTVNSQTLSAPPRRQGFTLVEWGGILDE